MASEAQVPAEPKPKATPAKSKSKAKAAPKGEIKFDESRSCGPDPQDPRNLGPPCNGEHLPARSYRGSVTGSNGHARWVGCERCKMRLLYVPTFGSTGSFRQAGALPGDIKEQVAELKEKASFNPALRDRTIALDEKSLLDRLARIRAQKEKIKKNETLDGEEDLQTNGHTEKANVAQGASSEDLALTPGRKMVRKAETTPEQKEYEERDETTS